ncbi:MAG: hypothetical protein NW218_06795 [Saprospiraceae bacterium]|nr:hypothetical protein [Saprospiraceae bacterium]
MAITKHTYANSQTIGAPFWRIVKSTEEKDTIVIVEVIGLTEPPQNTSLVTQEEVWLTVTADRTLTVLTSPPSTSGDFLPIHTDFDFSEILVAHLETFIIKHSATPFDAGNRVEVTGYSKANSDTLYIKIDHTNNSVSFYR